MGLRSCSAGAHYLVLLTVTVGASSGAGADQNGSRFAYLDQREPFYPHSDFPKLTTPMWIGEDGVDAVIALSIDDMRDPEHYERYLRPLLDRLTRIDGRAPVSIFTCQVKPTHPRLQQFLLEGLSLEVHTVTHPCPLLRGGQDKPVGDESLQPALRDVVDCVANLHQVPGNQPLVFRMPCCDSRNTVSPRFYTEVLPRQTRAGQLLQADSSIFNLFTPADQSLRREWLFDTNGQERFRKYIPFRNYALFIENYPYPFVIDRRFWELPAVIPTDWSAQNLHKPFNPQTVADWKAALDATVAKQGLFTLVFHPHNWILPEQLVELVDYADATYGKRVRFLNCREVVERLTRNLLDGVSLISTTGRDNGVRLADVNADGYLDVLIGNSRRQETRVWQPRQRTWSSTPLPAAFVAAEDTRHGRDLCVRLFTATQNGHAGLFVATQKTGRSWFQFVGDQWKRHEDALEASGETTIESVRTVYACERHVAVVQPVAGRCQQCDRALMEQMIDGGVRFRDLDGDGLSDVIVSNGEANLVYFRQFPGGWRKAPFGLPHGVRIVDALGRDQGVRFVDLDGDRDDDLVYSNESEFGVHAYEGNKSGWSRCVTSGPAGAANAVTKITHNGALFGAWFHGQAMYLANEFTDKKPDLVEKRLFVELLIPKQ